MIHHILPWHAPCLPGSRANGKATSSLRRHAGALNISDAESKSDYGSDDEEDSKGSKCEYQGSSTRAQVRFNYNFVQLPGGIFLKMHSAASILHRRHAALLSSASSLLRQLQLCHGLRCRRPPYVLWCNAVSYILWARLHPALCSVSAPCLPARLVLVLWHVIARMRHTVGLSCTDAR